jgi:hypothetical protein
MEPTDTRPSPSAVPPSPAAPPLLPPGPSSAGEPPSPWFSIWIRPRPTLRRILETDPRRHVLLLAALGGVASGLAAARSEMAATLTPAAAIAGAVAGGVVGGVIGVWLMGALLRISGRLVGGRGDWIQVRAAVAWAQVPAIWAILLWLPRAALLGGEMFHPEPAATQDHPASALALMLIEATQAVVAVWQFVVSLQCLGEAHAFPAWRALLAFVLIALAIAIPVALLVLGLGIAVLAS